MVLLIASIPVLPAGCDRPPEPVSDTAEEPLTLHSFARPESVAVTHLALDLTVDFTARRLHGRASLSLDRRADGEPLRLDTRGLEIRGVTREGASGEEDAPFELGEQDPNLGRGLTVELAPDTEVVHVDYATSPDAAAVQWLEPAQTSGDHPFLFTQSQAILARTWVPCQDTPAVRMTYSATVKVPPELMAVMSAENLREKSSDGVYRFSMPQPIPSYLLALAVGDLAFRPLSERAGVYAEPAVVEAAAWELAETEEMIVAAEALYGPYRWGRYDLLVLPPSFPFGGMENPRLTFATPTILAGDRSLTSLVAHELAHSWSGNLVTNANWNDFWLNEGFTTYFENRIMEAVYGPAYAEMLAALGLQDLRESLEREASRDTWLHLDLAGRDPDEGMTNVAYEKGALFLRLLETTVGRERWDAFLRSYFDRHAFQTMTSTRFVEILREELLSEEELAAVRIDDWIYGPGLPDNAPLPQPDAFAQVEAQLDAFLDGTSPAADIEVQGWTTHHWLHFVRGLPETLTPEQMAELDAAFGFSESGNSEVLHAWLLQAIRHGYRSADDALADFLIRQGRRKFLTPLYRALMDAGREEQARAIYRRARPGYHPVSRESVDEIVGVP